MILFAADNHYGQHCGRVLYEALTETAGIEFHEDDWSCFEQPGLADRYDLLICNFIAGTCDVPPPSDTAAANIRAYLETAKPILLLHGASAALWPWDWWRPIVGHRWVRGSDPDGIPASTHPTRPYRLDVAKTRHPLAQRLIPVDLPADEIYINLEQTCPTLALMTTTTDEGTFPQSYVASTPWGGTIAAYIPGHRPDVVRHPLMVANVQTLIDFLREPGP